MSVTVWPKTRYERRVMERHARKLRILGNLARKYVLKGLASPFGTLSSSTRFARTVHTRA